MKKQEIKIFENDQFGQVRTMCKDGEVWFVGKDVAKALGYANPQKAIRDHVDEEDKTVNDSFTVNGTTPVLINESGLYSLIFDSKLETARTFKHWVTSVVLPSIRKHGAYVTDSTLEEIVGDPDCAIRLFTTLKEERQARIEAETQNRLLSAQVESLEPLADYSIQILQSPNTVTVTQIAQDYGFSAITFNQMLCDLGVQYRQNDQWILYAKYKMNGYVQSNTTTYTRFDGSTGSKMYTRWTQQGRIFLYELLKGKGVLPLCERFCGLKDL